MSEEIVLRLPQSQEHCGLLSRKIDDYWKKAKIHTARASGTNEPATVIPGPELDLMNWSDDVVVKAIISREIIQYLLDNEQFESSQIGQLELYQFLVEKIGLDRIEYLLSDVMKKLFAYVTYEHRLRNSLPIETA